MVPNPLPILAPLLHSRYRSLWIVLFAIYVAFFLAWMTTALIASRLSRTVQLSFRPSGGSAYFEDGFRSTDISGILSRNLFDSKAAPFESTQTARRLDPDEAIPTSLSLKLIGTAVFSVPQLSMAVVQDKTSQQVLVLHIGDMALDGTLVRVERNKIYFERAGQLEYLEAEELARKLKFRTSGETASFQSSLPVFQPEGGSAPASDDGIEWHSPTSAVIQQREIEAAMRNMSQILTEARAVPNFVDGKQDGFKIFAIKSGSIFNRLGLQDGDILKRINGQELNDVSKAIALLQTLQNEKSIALDVIRDGQRKSYSFEIR